MVIFHRKLLVITRGYIPLIISWSKKSELVLLHAIGPRLWTTSRTAWATWNGAGALAQAGGMETGYHGIHGIFEKRFFFFFNGIL